MGRKRHTKTTEELLSLGMALHADRETMETRIRGIFSREKSIPKSIVLTFSHVKLSLTNAGRVVTAVTYAPSVIQLLYLLLIFIVGTKAYAGIF